MADLPPIVLGGVGLLGRQQVVRVPDLERPVEYDENGNPVFAQEPAPGLTIPSNCLRVLNSPLPVERGGGCKGRCPGLQEDGSCLADLVKRANAHGVRWSFDVKVDEYGEQHWTYTGDPVPAE